MRKPPLKPKAARSNRHLSIELPARGICPLCFEPVWRSQPAKEVNGKVYHEKCYRY